MRSLLAVCVALVVILGIVSGTLWFDLRSARHQNIELQRQPTPAGISIAKPEPVPAPVSTIQEPAASPPTAIAPREPEIPASVVSETAPQPQSEVPESLRRVGALMKAERNATARVQAWSRAFNLTAEQSQALQDIATDEMRREAEISFQIENKKGSGPLDKQTTARLMVESVNRQQEALDRIHERMKPQITQAQSNSMATMFSNWLIRDKARARAAELEAATSGN
jgi:hypothetical protein